MPYTPTSMANSGVFLSFLQSNGRVAVKLLEESHITNSTGSTDGPKIDIGHNVLQDHRKKRTNYNPHTSSYTDNSKVVYLRYGHSFDDPIDGTAANNGVFNIISAEVFKSMVISTSKWYRNDKAVTYQTILYNDIDDEAWAKLPTAANQHYLPVGVSGYLCSIKDSDYFIHDNYDIDMGWTGSVGVSENVVNNNVMFTVSNTANLNTINSAGIAGINTEITESNTGKNILTSDAPAYTYLNSNYMLSFPWDDAYYKSITGNSIADDNWNLTGYSDATLVSLYTGAPINYLRLPIDYTFTQPPPLTGYFYYDDADVMISGYYNDRSISVYTPETTTLSRMQLHYNTSTGEKFIPIKNVSEIDMDTYRDLRGKNCQIKSYYSSIASDYYLLSNPIVPIHNTYFDIKNVTLSISGVRDDQDLGNIEYSVNYLKEVNNAIIENKLHHDFMSIGVATCTVTFTAVGNTIDYDNVARVINPYPRDIWLIAIPKSGLSNTTLKDVFLQINESNIIANRDTNAEKARYPKISTALAKSMSELCTGSPCELTSEGILWNKLTPGNPEIPDDGTFTEEEYTIDVTLSQDSWAPFLVISDMGVSGHRNFTGYCLSNIDNYETPDVSSFIY
jgi:hypothetical protein